MTKIQPAWGVVAIVAAFAAFAVVPTSKAQGLSSCIEELALPGFASYIEAPGALDVFFTVGPDGRATAARFSTKDPMTVAYLRAYLVTESRYSKSCQGQQMHFVVTYTVQGAPTDEPRYETRLRAPSEIIVTYHPIKPKIN